MIMLIFQHSAKQLAFRGRTVETPREKPHCVSRLARFPAGVSLFFLPINNIR